MKTCIRYTIRHYSGSRCLGTVGRRLRTYKQAQKALRTLEYMGIDAQAWRVTVAA